ncbi:MAG: methylenetetrahydrofolate reductase [NAD(P)H] [Alphaproteobacteria bacterium]|nr:methylenetetrahydrofolate reductase [NAD(P)H] [Alphaproteobacteria bacterium]
MSGPTFSFEFFPPKTDTGALPLWETAASLAALRPTYMTVTYGAGGSTRDGTLTTVRKMQETGVPVAGHLTFINATRSDLRALAAQWWERGIRHIVALRGDMPDGLSWPLDPDGDYFQHTSDFVEALRSWGDFEISVGAYPEKHPDAPSADADIEALKKKCDAGATRAITQFFFDNAVFYDFVDRCRAAGITTPIYPGLLPVHDFARMCGFAARCRATVPDGLARKFAGLDNPEDIRKTATDILIAQALDLAANGVEHIHFYTLNKSDVVKECCEALEKRP